MPFRLSLYSGGSTLMRRFQMRRRIFRCSNLLPPSQIDHRPIKNLFTSSDLSNTIICVPWTICKRSIKTQMAFKTPRWTISNQTISIRLWSTLCDKTIILQFCAEQGLTFQFVTNSLFWHWLRLVNSGCGGCD